MTEVKTKKVELEVGKESEEVAVAVAELIKDIREGKDVATITAENLPNVMRAVEGYDQIDDEMKHRTRNATAAYSGYLMTEALIPVES
ncbi:hypothetical protein HBN50_07710 [Halobacteriovorax sp. GB3]|uniref:hypothetical protein n=1 Tax=Halobacteriovorax sp. GB3 TaxID=2719615 RepID=UPI00236275F8|nr:hypothetical protein [Halobacteriovorax sp. GB3]MDD0852977.1 hypothetical protein [Halobacteriovorax sp. GB3]